MEAKFFPEWEKMTVREVRAYLERRRSVIVPLGVTEQHGYHLPLCTDMLCARETAIRVGRKVGMIVAPPINTSYSGGTLPGTINVQPNVVGLVVGEVCRSLAVQGFRNIFLVLGHGGSENLRAMNNTLLGLLRDDPTFSEVMLVLAQPWRFHRAWRQGFSEGDWHAGWVETSLVMALAPELVQMEHLALDEPQLLRAMREHPDNYQYAMKPVESEHVLPRMAQRPEIEVGVMGDPSKASAELGRKIVEETVAEMSRVFVELERNRTHEYRKVPWTPEPVIL